MKKKMILGTLVTASLLFIIGYGANAFAGWGRGGGPGGCRGGDSYSNTALSAGEYKQMDEQRQAFFAATSELRQQIYEKDIALRSALAKENPDVTAAGKLQKDLSKLEGDLEQKRLAHMIEMRKVNPNAERGYAARGNRDSGSGGCGGGGGGPRCW